MLNYKGKCNTTQILPRIGRICYFVALRDDSLYFFDVLTAYGMDGCLNAGRVWARTPQIADFTDFADLERSTMIRGRLLTINLIALTLEIRLDIWL